MAHEHKATGGESNPEMPESSPTLGQWRERYATAEGFKKLAPWNWMLDSDVFGVQNPVDSEIGYCAVLGFRKEVFALVVYLGTEGFKVHQMMQSGEIVPGDDEALFMQRCLLCSFENRSELQPEDLAVIKKLGLSFRGRNAWPQFRSYLPSLAPWFLTQAEVVFLTQVLEQSVELCLRFKENRDLLTPRGEGLHLVRVRQSDSTWEDHWLKPAPCGKEAAPEPVCIDEVLLARVRKVAKEKRGTWEGDVFYAPALINDKERPYYPQMLLWVDRESSFILSTGLLRHREHLNQHLVEHFLKAAENVEVLPSKIVVKRESARVALESVASHLGIGISLECDLPTLEKVKSELFEKISQR
jgi:hypothetical protein